MTERGAIPVPPATPAPPAPLATTRFEFRRRQVRILSLILAGTAIAFVGSDAVLAAGDPWRLAPVLAIRVVVLAVLGVFVLRVVRVAEPERFERLVARGGWILAALMALIHASRPADLAGPYLIEIALLPLLYAFLPGGWRQQVGPAMLITGFALAMALGRTSALPPTDLVAIVVSLLVANLVGVTLGVLRRRLEAQEDALTAAELAARTELERVIAELSQLRGILPICAHCRRVRGDTGDWKGLETYVAAHLDAQFSHGICPDCLAEHYGHV